MMIIVIIKMIILYEIVFLYRYTDVCIIYVVVFERKKHYLSINDKCIRTIMIFTSYVNTLLAS